ncbi:unnamed protein product [Parnassius apollo]|uniref:unspecific monooxygenase n=1 Tax=Parnassius apollo TaxID=110799 RepID=A0A8S3YGZ0_PARAO|nr:unnamed protein product [Parnassius apollo]
MISSVLKVYECKGSEKDVSGLHQIEVCSLCLPLWVISMFWSLLIITALCTSTWLCLMWYKLSMYWAERGVKHVPVYPFLGSLTFLMRYNPAIWMRNVYESFDTPYVGMWVFFRPAVIINDPEIARNILIKDAAVFKDRFLSPGPSDPIGRLNLFTVKDPLWSFLRRRLTSVFTAAKLRGVFRIMQQKSKELVQRIDIEMKANKRVDLRMMFTDYTTDIIGASAFGVAGDATLTGESPLRSITKEFMEFNVLRGLSWVSIFFYPEIVDFFGFTAFPKSVTEYFRKIFRTIVAERGGYEVEIRENRDLLDALIKLKQDCVRDNEDISEDTLVAQAAVFLQAGFDTTGSIFAYCVYELAFHPEIQNKLYQELIEAKEKIGHADFEMNSLTELKYLDCVINETMRKYQPMGWLDRMASKDYKLDDRLTITVGTPVYVNVIGIHYDPKFYPEPERFNPDRFLSINKKNTNITTFVPFGDGPRSCIGRRFAMMNLRNTLATMFLVYEARALPNTPKPSEAKIEARNLFLAPGEPLLVKFVPRS